MAMHLPPLRLLRPLTTGLLAACAALAAAVATVPSPPSPYDHIVLVTLRLPAQAAQSSLEPEVSQAPLPFLAELAADTLHAARLLPRPGKAPHQPADQTAEPMRVSRDELAALLKDAGKSLTSYPLVPGLPDAADFEHLPTLAMTAPDGGTSRTALAQTDFWLRSHIGPYARWAADNNSLLIVLLEAEAPGASTGATSDHLPHQPVAALLYGARVQPGLQRDGVDAYGVLASVLHNQGLLGTLRKQIASRCSAEHSDCDQLLAPWRPTLGLL